MATCPVYPPGVLQTFTIPDPTSLDGLGDLEITLIPSRGVTDINYISAEGINAFKEMLYEADEEYRKTCSLKMNAIQTHINRFDKFAERTWYFNRTGADMKSWIWLNQEGPYDCGDCGWISYMDVPHFRDEYTAYIDYEIAEVLSEAEEDADYEEWINSKQYVKSLEEYNRHKLLAFEKGRSPDWVGECTEDKATTTAEKCVLYNTFLLDRFKLDAVVRTEFPNQQGDKGYAKASSPYGDIYIPNKFNGYIGLPGDPITLTVALQDVGGGGRKANGYRFTCIYIH